MGGKKKVKAPKAPDYAKLQTQQAALDRENDIFRMQNSGQSDMFGSSKYVLGPDGKYTQQNTMSPELEAMHRAAMANYSQSQQRLANQGAFTGPAQVGEFQNNAGALNDFQGIDQVQWDPNSGKAAADAFYQSGMSRLGPEQQKARDAQERKMRLQGGAMGNEAWRTTMRDIDTAQGDVNAKLGLDATVLGANEARQNYVRQLQGQAQNYDQNLNTSKQNQSLQGQRFDQQNQGWANNLTRQAQNYAQDIEKYRMPWEMAADSMNMMNGLRTGPQGYAPSWSGKAADQAGAAQQQFNSQMAKTNASNSKKGSTMGGVGGMVGGVMGK